MLEDLTPNCKESFGRMYKNSVEIIFNIGINYANIVSHSLFILVY